MPSLAESLLNWYAKHARALPWRGHADPYAVWVSEIMLQQTRVETVIPYFERWMALFPDIDSLARAEEGQVLSAWEGLGYYSRARNLQKAARLLVAAHGGRLPADMDALRRLPGVGRYTAGAIASMAFGQDAAALDGNIRRVLARVFDVSTPADSPAGERELWALAQANLPPGRAGDYNQALMDLGARICLPRKPLCAECPLADRCKSRGAPGTRPVLKPKAAVPHRLKMAAVITQDGRVLLAQRPSQGLLGGLWEFPAVEVDVEIEAALAAGLKAAYGLSVSPVAFMERIRHAYTHFTLDESAWRCDLLGLAQDPAFKWVAPGELDAYPMGKVDRRIASHLQKAG